VKRYESGAQARVRRIGKPVAGTVRLAKAGLWFRRGRLVMVSPRSRQSCRCRADNPLIALVQFSRATSVPSGSPPKRQPSRHRRSASGMPSPRESLQSRGSPTDVPLPGVRVEPSRPERRGQASPRNRAGAPQNTRHPTSMHRPSPSSSRWERTWPSSAFCIVAGAGDDGAGDPSAPGRTGRAQQADRCGKPDAVLESRLF